MTPPPFVIGGSLRERVRGYLGGDVWDALSMTSSSAQVNWVYLNRFAYLGVRDRRVVAVAYWTPETLGEEFSDDDPDGLSEPVIVEAGYFLVRVADGQGTGFATGPEPTGEWPDGLLVEAERTLAEWEL
jgi:hypothetical protein